MAKTVLPVNFQDDIVNASMNGKRRYNLIQNTDGTVSLEDVTTYDQVGSNFGAGQINATNKAVNDSADSSKIIDSISDIAANTKAGMMAGALAVKELNGSLKWATGSAAIGSMSCTVPLGKNEYLFQISNGYYCSSILMIETMNRGEILTNFNDLNHVRWSFSSNGTVSIATALLDGKDNKLNAWVQAYYR